MKSPAHGLALYLAGVGVGVFGSDDQWSINVNAEPESPADAVTLYDTGGGGQDTDELDISRPSLQVRVRGTSYSDVFAKHEEIKTALVDDSSSATIEGFRVIDILMTSNIATLGRDDQNRHVLVANYQAVIQKE